METGSCASHDIVPVVAAEPIAGDAAGAVPATLDGVMDRWLNARAVASDQGRCASRVVELAPELAQPQPVVAFTGDEPRRKRGRPSNIVRDARNARAAVVGNAELGVIVAQPPVARTCVLRALTTGVVVPPHGAAAESRIIVHGNRIVSQIPTQPYRGPMAHGIIPESTLGIAAESYSVAAALPTARLDPDILQLSRRLVKESSATMTTILISNEPGNVGFGSNSTHTKTRLLQ